MILWGTSLPPCWSAIFPNKVTIPFLKISSLCPMTSNVRLHSEHIHETSAEVLFILDKTKDITLITDICGLKEDSQMANRHMKRCSALLTSRERPLTLQWGATSYQSEWPSLDSWRITDAGEGCGEEGNPLTLLGEHKLVQPLWQKIWTFLKKSKNRVSIWSNNFSPEHISGIKLDLEKIHAPLCS